MTSARRPTARTMRFPDDLKSRVALDAERCGRSFEQQVLAILRRHYGEDVDLAPSPDDIVALARASVAGMSDTDQRSLSAPRRRAR